MSTSIAQTAEHVHRDDVGSRLGMWLFLFSELLLFGGLFLLYAVYRSEFPGDFHFAAATLDTSVGTLNTLILLTSSLTMALAIASLRSGSLRASNWLLAITVSAGAAFMVNKYFEWSAKIGHGLYPNSDELVMRTPGENVFYGLYYTMTGVHGMHVLIGMGVLGVLLCMQMRKPRRSTILAGDAARSLVLPGERGVVSYARITLVYEENAEIVERGVPRLENAGLYWHLVDVIWIFLFPLFYLIS